MASNCNEDQLHVYTMQMTSILEKLEEYSCQLAAQKVLEENHAREIFAKIDHLGELISGGGRQGTGIAPRLSMVEFRADANEKSVQRVEVKLEDYIKERTTFERRLTWGIITAIGTACLGILTQFVGGRL